MTKKLDRMDRIQFVEDQRRALMNAAAVINVAAHAAADDMVDREQLSDAMLVAGRMVDDVATRLEALTKT
jgi:hypothetical protein